MADVSLTSDHSGNGAAYSLLNTKLFIPQARHLQDVLPRPRLIEQLKNGVSRRLTLISAPAGFGKTTLLAQWIPHSERCVCWLSLDEADNDLTRFLTYVIAALNLLQADFGQPLLQALQSPQPPAVESLMTALVNEIVQTLDEFVLVLDDYHLLHLPAIQAAVAFLLNNLPPNMHLIIASRADPALPLARLRVRGQLNELRAADLRFTPAEVTTFFQQIKVLPLPTEHIEELETRTEGWGAGLHLAALSLQGLDEPGISRFIRNFTGSHHHVFDYLAEEVLQQQPEEIQHFLLQTSILTRLCAPLCDAVLGRDEGGRILAPAVASADVKDEENSSSFIRQPSASILEYLEHANLFLVPLDNERRWYRYHHLFAEVLRNRLRQTRPDSILKLHRRASRWFEAERLVDEAVSHALAGRDFEEAAHLIESVVGDMLRRGFSVSPIRWLDEMPAEIIRARPRLCLARAWTFHMGPALNLESAEAWAQLALQAASDSGLQDPDLTGEVAALQAMIAATRGQVARSRELAIQAQRNLPHHNPWHSTIAFCLGTAHLVSGDMAAAAHTLSEALRLSQADGLHYIQLAAASFLADIAMVQGQLDRAIDMYRQVLDWAGHGVPQKGAVMARGGQAHILYERNELDAALAQLHLGAEQIDQVGGAWSALAIYRVLARVQQARGNWAEALATLDRAYQVGQSVKVNMVATVAAALRADLQLAQGNLKAASDWAANSGLNSDDAEADHPGLREVEYFSLARVLNAQGRRTEALSLLDRLMGSAESEGRYGSLITVLLLQALILHTQGNLPQALAFLERALNLAEPEGYIRTFVDEGPPMAALLHEAYSRVIMPAYTGRLLAAFDFRLPILDFGLDTTQKPKIQNRKSEIQNLVEPLSKRELEILALMAQGLTNPEIARQIFISAQTVKVHTRNIYGKLGVNSRRQAVAKARALGLLA
ncbi:MAG: HTH-type transcriptional regulator MalT [Anaerolineae bacterium]|nr:HTH-type transcriptional regulator MalT [Anaerolineae bacterium]